MQDDYYDYEEEEEWDREQLLDPAWEKQQKKVCPPWMIHPPTSENLNAGIDIDAFCFGLNRLHKELNMRSFHR